MVNELLRNLILQNLHDHEFLIEKQDVEIFREQLSKIKYFTFQILFLFYLRFTNFSSTIVSPVFSIYACTSLDRAGIFPLRSQNEGVIIN